MMTTTWTLLRGGGGGGARSRPFGGLGTNQPRQQPSDNEHIVTKRPMPRRKGGAYPWTTGPSDATMAN